MNKLYQVNDNLFVIIDALMTDSRWDMKFLGMQIMVEGLALGAFGTLQDDEGTFASRPPQDGDSGRGAPRSLWGSGVEEALSRPPYGTGAQRTRGLGLQREFAS